MGSWNLPTIELRTVDTHSGMVELLKKVAEVADQMSQEKLFDSIQSVVIENNHSESCYCRALIYYWCKRN